MRFFTSDLHLGHVNIMKYGRGDDFADLDDMRESFITNINSMVSPDDELYILGDVVMAHRAEQLPHLDRINGRKHLILGNHDYPHPCNPEKVQRKHTSSYARHFESMCIARTLPIGDTVVLLTHFPSTLDHKDEVRYPEYRPRFAGPILHGHVHAKDVVLEPSHIHVGIDADYTEYGIPPYHPIPEATIQTIMEEMK